MPREQQPSPSPPTAPPSPPGLPPPSFPPPPLPPQKPRSPTNRPTRRKPLMRSLAPTQAKASTSPSPPARRPRQPAQRRPSPRPKRGSPAPSSARSLVSRRWGYCFFGWESDAGRERLARAGAPSWNSSRKPAPRRCMIRGRTSTRCPCITRGLGSIRRSGIPCRRRCMSWRRRRWRRRSWRGGDGHELFWDTIGVFHLWVMIPYSFEETKLMC